MDTSNEVAGGVERMRIVGGNLALDFLNTRAGPPNGPPDDDLLVGYDGLVAWAKHAGSLTELDARRLQRQGQRDRPGAHNVINGAIRLRDELDAIFRAIATGHRPPERSVAALRTAEAEALTRAALLPEDGGFAWSWAADRTLARPLGPVIHAAIELLTSGPLDLLKACGGCSFLFVDESNNRSRRWYSMDDCGSNEKVRRFVARRAGRPLD